MNGEVISYDSKGFIINGQREFLIGGEFHYFRVPAAHWEDRLGKMKNMGANLISVYIPWNIHEPVEGEERWKGDYDLEYFLALCEEYGLYVLIKPGPYVCAELDFGGHPDWLITKVIKDGIKLRMLDEGYLKLCRRWYKRVSEKINDHLITNGGNIIAIQIENEYDHLIEYGEENISEDDAVDYFLFLRDTMEEFGIDIPKFANEAVFLRGKGIIDTRTYYPNIPGLWMWEFDLFENKIIESKKGQNDSPVMILELQAGWFAQNGVPIYEPGLDVVGGVSRSVLIQGASILNYYMMVGGTTFPFMGARGDIFFLGGLGNITSYDFGGSPIRESGEIHPEKYYWIKGFIRFAKEFAPIILNSDGKNYVRLTGGGEDIAVLANSGAVLDTTLDRGYENFKVYEEGNEDGRFFFIRNLEKKAKVLDIKIDQQLMGEEYNFTTKVLGRETRMLPINFTIPGTDILIHYASSELLMSRKYNEGTIFVLYGKKGSRGELSLDLKRDELTTIKGDFECSQNRKGILLSYIHDDIIIIKIKNEQYLFIVDDSLSGRIEEIEKGLLFHNLYYVEEPVEEESLLKMGLQIKEGVDYKLRIFSLNEDIVPEVSGFDKKASKSFSKIASNLYEVEFNSGNFLDKPVFEWSSNWTFAADSDEIKIDYDHSNWVKLEEPVSLEEVGFIEHGYFWYRAEFNIDRVPEKVFMDYKHNDTDRMFIYINEELIYKSHNKKIQEMDITAALKKGSNTMAILYASEFHNKSHPHEGDIIKYSGIMNPFKIYGKDLFIRLKSFYVKQGLTGVNKGYQQLDYNEQNWQQAPEAKKYVPAAEMGHITWFRRRFRYNLNDDYEAPLILRIKDADQILIIYINGKPVARYDNSGPQYDFYIPPAYLKNDGENLISIILEGPGFYDELQSGYRRGFMYQPEIVPVYTARKLEAVINFK